LAEVTTSTLVRAASGVIFSQATSQSTSSSATCLQSGIFYVTTMVSGRMLWL
jgi:hypothetical protein